jgi:flagellar biosynthesis chaperone FliJ
MPTTATSTGIFGLFASIFKSKDPFKKELTQSLNILERMLRTLETSKKNLESVMEEHKKKINLYSSDHEMGKILSDEIHNINGYISVINKAIYDLIKVKYRLETLFYVEEPLKELPTIVEELKSIEPIIEQINPQLLNNIKLIEQKVASLMAISSSYIPGLIPRSPSLQDQGIAKLQQSKPITSAQTMIAVDKPTGVKVEEKPMETTAQVKSAIKTPQIAKGVETREAPKVLEQPLQQQVAGLHGETRELFEPALVKSNVPLNVVEEWILHELKLNGGVLNLKLFEAKYGVSKEVVFEALRSLEAKGKIRLRRK